MTGPALPFLRLTLLYAPAIVNREQHEERDQQDARNRDLVGESHDENSLWWKDSFTAKISGSTCAVLSKPSGSFCRCRRMGVFCPRSKMLMPVLEVRWSSCRSLDFLRPTLAYGLFQMGDLLRCI
jgi:hypothetical protein